MNLTLEVSRVKVFSPLYWLAFAAIYLIWGSTFLAIRVAVRDLPPLLAASIRFLAAGAILYLWARLAGAATPTRKQWRNLLTLGFLMFFVVYAALFWAEKYVPSGIASVLVATLPMWTMLLEALIFRTLKLAWTLLVPLVTGLRVSVCCR